MPSVGLELKQARERLALSIQQIEERTKVQAYKIEALENGDLDRLPDGIYLDGIIRAYAHEVGLNPEPLIEQSRAERENVDWEAEAPFGDLDALFRKEEATESRTPTKIDRAGESLRSGWPGAAAPREDVVHDDDAVVVSTHSGLFGSRGAEIDLAAARAALTPFEPEPRRSRLILPLLALVAFAGWSAYLYEVYRRPATAAVSVPSPAPSDVPKDNQATTGGNLPSPADEQRRALAANAGAVERESAGTAGTAVPPAQPPPDAAPKSPNAEPPAEPPTAGTPAATRSASTTVAPAGDVSGNWRLSTRVEASNTSEFTGLNLGFDIQFHQAGNRITGTGRKVIENGAAIAGQAQTPIFLAGTIAGDRLTLTFTERGALRSTQGKFVLLLEDAGTLRGRFTSTAAQSSGRVEAHRAVD